MHFTALNSGILFRIKEKRRHVSTDFTRRTYLSAGAGVSTADLTKAGRVFQADCTVYWLPLVSSPN